MINDHFPNLNRLHPGSLLLLTACLFGIGGCSNSPSESGLSDSAAAPQQHDGAQTSEPTRSETATGTSDVGGAEQVAGSNANPLPEGVLAYPEAIRVESLRLGAKESKAPPGVVMFVSTEPDVAKVAAWYERELVSAGWAVVERNEDDGSFCLFQKAGKEVSVSVGTIPEPKPDGHADANLLIVVDASQ